jgi:hypothetical protein
MPISAVFRPFDAVLGPLLGRDRETEPVYHRFSGPEEADKVQRTGELWGAPPRNIFASSIPCVKAYAGRLPAGGKGYEFTTPVQPSYASRVERRWVAGSPGVTVEGDFARIPVTVLRNTAGSR